MLLNVLLFLLLFIYLLTGRAAQSIRCESVGPRHRRRAAVGTYTARTEPCRIRHGSCARRPSSRPCHWRRAIGQICTRKTLIITSLPLFQNMAQHLDLGCVFVTFMDPSTLGAGGPNQNTSRPELIILPQPAWPGTNL